MKFSVFSDILSKIGKKPLPGRASHLKMVSAQRAKILNDPSKFSKNPKKAAVLAAFYPDQNEETHLLLIKRQGGKDVHAHQIALPGGQYEPSDIDLKETALREAFEEVGILQAQVRSIIALSAVYIPPSNFLVQPYMALYDKQMPFVLETSEVHSVIEVPLALLVREDIVKTQWVQLSHSAKIKVPGFAIGNELVWGATAMMLSEIRTLLNDAL
jgi:8-oxo-dGTP pyrophosphatase MutT (NUDIX family)